MRSRILGTLCVLVASGCVHGGAAFGVSASSSSEGLTLVHQDLKGCLVRWAPRLTGMPHTYVRHVRWALALDGKQVSSGDTNTPADFGEDGTATPVLLMPVTYVRNAADLSRWNDEKTLRLELRATVYLARAGSGGKLEVRRSAEIPAPRAPVATLFQKSGTRFSDGTTLVKLVLAVHNPNSFPVTTSEVPYFARLNGREAAEGIALAGRLLHSNETATYPLSLELDPIPGARAARPTLELPFELKGAVRGGLFNRRFDLKGEVSLNREN